MHDNEWKIRAAIERRYFNSLSVLAGRVRRITSKVHSLNEIITAIENLTYSPQWEAVARQSALAMVKAVAVSNARTWREAARQSQRAALIHRILKQEFENNGSFQKILFANARLIKSLPADIARHAAQHAASKAIAGVRAESIIDDLRTYAPHLAESRVRLIARTETAKAQSAITQVRATQAGLKYYLWRTSEDQRVRSSHKHMHGVACSFSSPPSPEKLAGVPSTLGYYGPGECPNCRCYAEPIIDLDFTPFPLKVAQGERIVRMTRKDFEAIQ